MGGATANARDEKSIGDLKNQNLPLLIENVTAIAVRRDDLRGMTAQEVQQALAEEAKLMS